jgi:hypothetical protein
VFTPHDLAHAHLIISMTLATKHLRRLVMVLYHGRVVGCTPTVTHRLSFIQTKTQTKTLRGVGEILVPTTV